MNYSSILFNYSHEKNVKLKTYLFYYLLTKSLREPFQFVWKLSNVYKNNNNTLQMNIHKMHKSFLKMDSIFNGKYANNASLYIYLVFEHIKVYIYSDL